VTADDFAAFELQFARGGIGYVMLNVVATVNEANSLSFYGSSGTLSFRDGQLWYAREGESELRDITPQHSVAIPGSISGLYPEGTVYLGHALTAALHDGDRAALSIGAGFRDGLHVQAALDAVRRAEGGWESL
jgi:predicted dehydrogenase